ncbi:hypothetical protein LBMAG53_25110 [Planctomycetota bacterium]|nr:hypothetical protein LBMAG53_25110 [Planctomycetota bacterium]
MGDHQYIYLALPGMASPLVMKHHRPFNVEAGQALAVCLDTARAQFFAGPEETAVYLVLPR